MKTGKPGNKRASRWFQQRLKKLFETHVRGRLFAEDQKPPANVYLRDETGRRAAEILAEHQGVTRHRYKAALRHMELRAKRRAKHGLP